MQLRFERNICCILVVFSFLMMLSTCLMAQGHSKQVQDIDLKVERLIFQTGMTQVVTSDGIVFANQNNNGGSYAQEDVIISIRRIVVEDLPKEALDIVNHPDSGIPLFLYEIVATHPTEKVYSLNFRIYIPKDIIPSSVKMANVAEFMPLITGGSCHTVKEENQPCILPAHWGSRGAYPSDSQFIVGGHITMVNTFNYIGVFIPRE